MKNRVCVYVADHGFLVPSLVSAKQLALSKASELADIIIYLLGIEPEVVAKLENSFTGYEIKFIVLDTNAFAPPSSVSFRQGHVPIATLARLVLADYIPANYKHVVYLDGDTQIMGDITPLLKFEVPEGKIAAVNGSIWLTGNTNAEWNKQYLKNLGGVDQYQYFNGGVLAFQLETWAEIGPQALKFFFENSEACYHHDQSALNAVCKGRRVTLEPAYNFHSEYAKLCVKNSYNPRIVHFTGNTKPWMYPVAPWGRRFTQPYIDILNEHVFLNDFMKKPVEISFWWQSLRDLKKYAKNSSQCGEILSQRKLFFKYINNTRFAW